MKHLLIILSLLLAGSANCQVQDTALVADTATSVLSDEQLFELGKKDGRAGVGKGTTPFFSSEAYVNGWNEGTQMQSGGKRNNHSPVIALVTIAILAILVMVIIGIRSLDFSGLSGI